MSEQLWSDERIRSVLPRFVNPADVAIAVRDDYQHRLSLLETVGQWPSGYPERVEELLGELAAAQERIKALEAERDEWRTRHADCTTKLITADRKIARMEQPHE